MTYQKVVSADDLTWPHAYCGKVKLHPNDDAIQQYLDSDVPLTSEPNGEGIELILVAYKSKSMTAHFRRKEAISSEYLNMVRKNIHNRVVDVVSRYIKTYKNVALNSICKADLFAFKYASCFVERELTLGDIRYRPDIVVYQNTMSNPHIELEVVFTHDIEFDRREQLSKNGHVLLSINIEKWVNDLAQQEIEDVSDEEILSFVKRKKFSYYTKKEKVMVERVWYELSIIDNAKSFVNSIWDGERLTCCPTTAMVFFSHLNALTDLVNKNYSDETTKKAKEVIITYHCNAPEVEDVLKKYKDKVIEKTHERHERELKEEREKQERIRERKLKEERERQKRKERLSIEIESQKEAADKRKIKLEMLKKKFFIGQ